MYAANEPAPPFSRWRAGPHASSYVRPSPPPNLGCSGEQQHISFLPTASWVAKEERRIMFGFWRGGIVCFYFFAICYSIYLNLEVDSVVLMYMPCIFLIVRSVGLSC